MCLGKRHIPLSRSSMPSMEQSQSAALYIRPLGQFSRTHRPLSVYCSNLVGAPEIGALLQPMDIRINEFRPTVNIFPCLHGNLKWIHCRALWIQWSLTNVEIVCIHGARLHNRPEWQCTKSSYNDIGRQTIEVLWIFRFPWKRLSLCLFQITWDCT